MLTISQPLERLASKYKSFFIKKLPRLLCGFVFWFCFLLVEEGVCGEGFKLVFRGWDELVWLSSAYFIFIFYKHAVPLHSFTS